jgi:hypothetical protein
MKPFGQGGDCLFIIQIEIVLFDLLLHEAPGHQKCSTELIGFDLFMINSSRRVSVSSERQMAIDKEL